MEEILRPRVRQVDIFNDAREALAFVMASTVRPDIVLTDINLPVVSGEKFRDEVKALYPHTRLSQLPLICKVKSFTPFTKVVSMKYALSPSR